MEPARGSVLIVARYCPLRECGAANARDTVCPPEILRMFHNIGKLADIAGPFVFEKHIDRLAAEQIANLIQWSSRSASSKVARKRWDVRATFPQCRQANFKRIDAEIEIFPKVLFSNHRPQIAIRGAQDADIGAKRLGLADAANLARLQKAQQFDLNVLVELADFVEEERAAVGYFEQPLVVAVGAGEGALAMAEQFALDEVLGEGTAVYGTKGISARLPFW